jgi:hypothetical protein
MRSWQRWLSGCVVVCGLGCSKDVKTEDAGARDASAAADAGNPGPPVYESAVYALDENWLCNPAATTNRCQLPRSATEIGIDNSLSEVSAPTERIGSTDCFYVYPTIDVSFTAAQTKNYDNIESIWASAKQQAELFSHLCTVYAPLYHQATIGAYFSGTRDTLLDMAYQDVDDAFRHYMAQYNKGHDIIFIGHSQGSHMLRRLLQNHFDGDANQDTRKQLSLAVLLGALGDIQVPAGMLAGGTFKDIPVCSDASQRGCVITYSSYDATTPPGPTYGLATGGIAAGQDTPCTNPAALSGGKATSSGAYFLSTPLGTSATTSSDLASTLMVKTEFAVYRNMYSLECKQTSDGHSYLLVSPDQPAGATRKDPIQYGSAALQESLLGLHILDFNIATADLAAIIQKHVE